MENKDIFGKAFLHYLEKKTGEIEVHSDEMETDVVKCAYFFREWDQMPPLEQQALSLASGKILDVGSGSGCHSLELQKMGKTVVSLEISEAACSVQKQRGVDIVICQDIFSFDPTEKFDTILLMMNGIGVCGTLDKLNPLLEKLKSLLNPGGTIIFDSSDLIYLFMEEDGSVWIDLNGSYYGEVHFQVEFNGEMDSKFPWVYIDPKKMEETANLTGLQFDVIQEGEHYDYLAQLQ
ncbi:MAG: SAM-dependent methyltransferase [Luteibaculaceae bacterium]